uniref:Uncharacterized protein n=1 Tax=viral metagenome TaxID=1070528 RepID=A0A6C0M0Q6_9ZZZZ
MVFPLCAPCILIPMALSGSAGAGWAGVTRGKKILILMSILLTLIAIWLWLRKRGCKTCSL